MRELTENQIEFIVNLFFKDEKTPNWKEIARTLCKEGFCTVAGTRKIWSGGVGNFIKYSDPKLAFGCLRLDFDLDSFLESEMFKESVSLKVLEKLKVVKVELENYYDILAIAPEDVRKSGDILEPVTMDSDYLETHYEIVTAIERFRETSNVELGTGECYELAQKWTVEFMEKYGQTKWGEEIQWLDTLEEFLNQNFRKIIFSLRDEKTTLYSPSNGRNK